ncbi:hypothetical protein O3G_MSEX008363 [Manduca sexta]|nr:hypothetical protein O3G_MSEX008363 [Manduca sexta]
MFHSFNNVTDFIFIHSWFVISAVLSVKVYNFNKIVKMATEVEETIKRIQAHKGVMGVVIVNHEGIPIKSSLDNATSVLYAGLIGQLTEKARNVVREMDSTNELTFLRVRSRRHEILIAPDREFILIVIQNTSD